MATKIRSCVGMAPYPNLISTFPLTIHLKTLPYPFHEFSLFIFLTLTRLSDSLSLIGLLLKRTKNESFKYGI